jgi:hypothetical protein
MLACVAVLLSEQAARAQPPPFGIIDNSFLVEEAFNQDMGTFQNILSWTRGQSGDWEASFTQEWPALVTRHQLSYSVPLSGGAGARTHVGSVQVNYRYQVVNEGLGNPAFAPRVSLILPTGSRDDGSDRPGFQVNLPISKQQGRLYLHANAGLTWRHAVTIDANRTATLTSPQIAASVVWNARQLFNVLVETVLSFDDNGVDRTATLTLSPGFRAGWNVGEDRQIVVGAAVPTTVNAEETSVGVLGYLSYELPFRARR